MLNFMMGYFKRSVAAVIAVKRSVAAVAVALVSLFAVGCNDTNFDIGNNFLSDAQEMVMGYIDLQGYKEGSIELDDRVMSTKLYRTERIATSRQYTGALGSERSALFGDRQVGFFAQYTPQYSLDDEGFGYEPIVDSVVMLLSVADYSGDTMVVQRYNVYEVLDDTFLTTSTDSIFNFDYKYPTGTLSSEPIFTFNFPDPDNDYYVYTGYVKASVKSAGKDFLNRLMLKKGEDGSQIDYTYYSSSYDFDDFVESFKGLYICPADDSALSSGGATYSFSLSGTGFGFYGRSMYEEDLSIVADTLGMSYIFYDSNVTDIGGVSITTGVRDYSTGSLASDIDGATTDLAEGDAHISKVYVEGLGGVATQLTLEREMFEEFERLLAEANDGYTTIFFNAAKLMIYREEATVYDEPMVMSPTEVDAISTLPSRLGLYRVYSSFLEDWETSEMETATDYNYTYEVTYSVVSDFDGGLNRSLGCYKLNIPLEMQTIWTEYCDAKEEAGGDPANIDWAAQDWNKLIIAQTVDNLLSPRRVSLQGEADGVNDTPIRLSITYTLLKQGS